MIIKPSQRYLFMTSQLSLNSLDCVPAWQQEVQKKGTFMRKRIAIVGNGQVDDGTAPMIDRYDFVIRFNDCRSFGSGGRRTDVVAVCNTGRPARKMLETQAWRSHPAIVGASEIWSVRDPKKLAQMSTSLAVAHPELDDFCEDYTTQFKAFCTETGKRHSVIDKAIHEAVDNTLAAYRPGPYVVPSSGMIVIRNVLDRFSAADVALAGFGHEGWEGHPFAAERKLVDSYVAIGRLMRLPGVV